MNNLFLICLVFANKCTMMFCQKYSTSNFNIGCCLAKSLAKNQLGLSVLHPHTHRFFVREMAPPFNLVRRATGEYTTMCVVGESPGLTASAFYWSSGGYYRPGGIIDLPI